MRRLLLLFTIVQYATTFNVLAQTSTEIEVNLDSVWYHDYTYNTEMYQQAKPVAIAWKTNKIDKTLSKELCLELEELDRIYKAEINDFLTWYRENSESENRSSMMYLSSCIRFENYYIFPQTYSILLNPTRLTTNKKLSKKRYQKALGLVHTIQETIKNEGLETKLSTPFNEYLKTKRQLDTSLFSGSLSEQERLDYSWIDFLVLLSR